MAQPRLRTSPLRAPCIAVLVPLALALLAAWPVLALGTLVRSSLNAPSLSRGTAQMRARAIKLFEEHC